MLKLQTLDISDNKIGERQYARRLVNPILKRLDGVALSYHIQGLPQGVSDNEGILKYLRTHSKIKKVPVSSAVPEKQGKKNKEPQPQSKAMSPNPTKFAAPEEKKAAVKTAQAVPKQQSAVAVDSKQASSAAASFATRVQDLDLASMGLLPPICGVMAQPLVSLAEACAGLGSLVSNLDTLVFFAAKAGKKLAKSHQQHLLTADECGSIYLYTCESGVYRQMNRALRNKDRSAVKPWFKYLRLLFSAISKLPAVTENVWRGLSLPDAAEAERQVKSLQEMKEDEDTLFWWGASSCTVDMTTSLQFTVGKYAPYTRIMFQVRCIRGARIETLSAIGNEKEVLLLPGSSFQIKNLAEVAPKLWIVELQEETLPGNIKPVS
eukprot:g18939.t1